MFNWMKKKLKKNNALRIVSDGTVSGTKITDSNGNPINGVTHLDICIDAESNRVRAAIDFYPGEIDIVVRDKDVSTSEECKSNMDILSLLAPDEDDD